MAELTLQAPPAVQSRATLLDLLDRVLGKGVVAYGDIVLSIADLDLVYLNLRAVLSSIGTLEGTANGRAPLLPPSYGSALEPAGESKLAGTRKFLEGDKNSDSWLVDRGQKNESVDSSLPTTDHPLPTTDHPLPTSPPGKKLELDPQKTAQGLAKLAMTLINLLRKLMERQAIRRMEAGTVTPEQLERAGQAFQRLDNQIKELCKQFGLKEEDLNLDLGPLGKVV